MRDAPEPLVFSRVEALRKHMLLTVAQMAKIVGVSRVTYSGWVDGKPMRAANNLKVRAAVTKMFKAINEHEWPSPEIIGMTSPQRMKALLELMGQSE